MLSGGDGRINSGGASTPDRLLGCKLARKVQRFFQTPRRNKAGYLQGSKIDDEFLFLELRFQEILPFIWHFIFGDKFLVVRYDGYGACSAQHVLFDRVQHTLRNFEDTLSGHSVNVMLAQIS